VDKILYTILYTKNLFVEYFIKNSYITLIYKVFTFMWIVWITVFIHFSNDF